MPSAAIDITKILLLVGLLILRSNGVSEAKVERRTIARLPETTKASAVRVIS
jgi:hypothetical protein